MDSPETDSRPSYDASAQSGQARRGPNPNRDYKRHFNRQKERYNTVTADQVNRKKELNRASAKQWKLQDEIEFVIDAIAGERHRRQQASTGEDLTQSDRLQQPSSMAEQQSCSDQSYTQVIEKDEEDVKPILTAKQAAAAAAAATSKKDAVDEDLEELLDEQDSAAPAKVSRRSGGTATSSTKRQRSFSSSEDMDDELLEAAGVSSSKKARNR